MDMYCTPISTTAVLAVKAEMNGRAANRPIAAKISQLQTASSKPWAAAARASSSRPSPRRRLIRELRPTPVPMATAISRFCTGNTSETAVSASSLTLATK